MHCEVLKNNEGKPIGMICGVRRAPRRVCKFCNRDFVRKLCDFPSTPSKTCDAGMCDRCATSTGPDRDYCPNHKDQKPAAEQGALFGD
jgi:hypothetical protein